MSRVTGWWKVGALALLCFLIAGAAMLQGQAPQKQQAPPAPPSASPPVPPAGQQPDSPFTIGLTVQRVNVPFTVFDSKNRYVTDLPKDNFAVFEDGKKVPIDFFTAVSTLPLRVGMLLDTSNSVRLMFKSEQEAAIDFVHELLPDRTRHKAFLMTFDTTKDVLHDFTSDPNEIADAIRKLKVGGGTALFDAIYHACWDKLVKQTAPGGVRRVLLLVTDGEDDASKYSLPQVIEIARRAQVSIYAISTIAYGQASPGEKVLETLAEETGGAVVAPWKKPPSAEFGTGYLSRTQIGEQNAVYEAGTGKYAGEAAAQLAMALAQVKNELTMQYTIGYRPPNPQADGTFRQIRVEVKGGYRIRSKKGYYAAPPL